MMKEGCPGFEYFESVILRTAIKHLREKVLPILSINLLHHFTDHSVAHSDRLIHIVDQIIKPIQTSEQKLNDRELMIVYGACYLHDIGMEFEKAGDTQTMRNAVRQMFNKDTQLLEDEVGPDSIRIPRLERRWQDLEESTRRNLLREHHNRLSAEMVLESIRSENPLIGFQITGEFEPERVACLCEAHNIDVESAWYQQLTPDGPNIRMGFLCGLLRLADILDESRRRAPIEKAQLLELNLEEQSHWWRHYYTEDITFDQEQKVIRVWFDFPAAFAEEYRKIIPSLQIPWISQEMDRYRASFNKLGLSWSVESEFPPKPYSSSRSMPDDVCGQMLKQLYRKKTEDAKNRRQMLMEAFSEARSLVDRRLAELEAQKAVCSQPEYLRKLFGIARDLWDFGGRRSAWCILYPEYRRHFQELDKGQQLDMGLWLAQIMIEDDMADMARHIFMDLQKIAESLPDDDPKKFEYWRLRAECWFDILHPETADVIQRSIDTAPDKSSKQTQRSRLGEWYLLQGELSSAIDNFIDQKDLL